MRRFRNATFSLALTVSRRAGEGPNEHDMALLSDNQTLIVVLRIDGNDGGPPYCSVRHTPKNYHAVFSSDGGYTWTTAVPMRDVNGRGMGTAFPRLLRLGDRCVASHKYSAWLCVLEMSSAISIP